MPLGGSLLGQVTLSLLNWMAPCTIKSPFQHGQAAMMGFLASESMASMGLVLLPTFTYNRGQLWIQEASSIKMLASQAGLGIPYLISRGALKAWGPIHCSSMLERPSNIP